MHLFGEKTGGKRQLGLLPPLSADEDKVPKVATDHHSRVSECAWVRTTRSVWKMSGGERGRWLRPNRRSLHFFPLLYFSVLLLVFMVPQEAAWLSFIVPKGQWQGRESQAESKREWIMGNGQPWEMCSPSLKCSREGGYLWVPRAWGHRIHLSFTKLVIFISKRCSRCRRGSQI